MYMPSALPRSTTLVSPVTTSTPARRLASAMAAISARNASAGESFLEDERGRDGERPSARDGEVVDRAVHGELADRTAREAQRVHDEGVGGEGQPFDADSDRRRVVERRRATGCRATG